MKLIVDVWRQKAPEAVGTFHSYELDGCDERMSILELLDHLNRNLSSRGVEPVAFDSDCREGICGACGIQVDGRPHGFSENLPACMQMLGAHADGTHVRLEPLRSGAFPVIRDLVVDRSVLDRITMAGGFASVDTGLAPDVDAIPIRHQDAEGALDLAACIGCGACVAACPNGSAALYAGARMGHLAALNIPGLERAERARRMNEAMDQYFGSCSGYGECIRVCPANIPFDVVAVASHERLRALWSRWPQPR